MAVTDEAIEKIKGMIVSGALRPGDRLPKESELASELGLSRNSLREAVRALSLIRILDVRQGDGTYVTSLDPQLLLEALSFVVDFHRDDTVLEFLLDGLSGPTTRARIWRGLTQEDAVSRTLHEHRAILAALRDRDAEAARSWATVHIASVEQWLRSTL